MVAVKGIKEALLNDEKHSNFTAQLGDCLIVNHEGKLFLQKRPLNWGSAAGRVTLFGGHVEAGETPYQAMVREIEEETGAKIQDGEAIFIGAVTEDETDHQEIIHIYFFGTIRIAALLAVMKLRLLSIKPWRRHLRIKT